MTALIVDTIMIGSAFILFVFVIITKMRDEKNNVGEDDPIKWVIRHPGKAEYITGESFEECMEKWFEGFNLPFMYVNGVSESFEDANQRVKDYFDNMSHGK